MTEERDNPPGEDEPAGDDLVRRSERLREHAEELEEEEREVEDLERSPREWLAHEERLHRPSREPEAEETESS